MLFSMQQIFIYFSSVKTFDNVSEGDNLSDDDELINVRRAEDDVVPGLKISYFNKRKISNERPLKRMILCF